MDLPDRRIHARYDGFELVRYDRAGKWFVEGAQKRRAVKLSEAVTVAVGWLKVPGGEVIFGLHGGTSFDAKVRAATS